MAKDARFEFTGKWIPFSSDYSASTRQRSHFVPVSFKSEAAPLKQFGTIRHIERKPPKFSEPAFMPTKGASFAKINDDHLKLHDGAVVVRAGDRPVFVSTRLCDEDVITRVAGNAIALISAFDQKPTVLNLTDRCCGAVVLHLPSGNGTNSNTIGLNAGEIAEAYRLDTTPTSNLVATRIDINKQIGQHCGLLVSQCHYVRALRKFNLVAALPQSDLNRILKTAAALHHVKAPASR